jgi:hypothetical protein
MSAREDIAKNIVEQLENMTDPAPGKVSRVFFDVSKLAITQFPAILVVTNNEVRDDISMNARQGIIQYELRCYVRGTEVDTLRNEIIERVEETLELSRDRDIALAVSNIHNVKTQVRNIDIVDRELPLGECIITVDVKYTYKKGVL